MGKQIIKVFQDYDGVLSFEDLQEASDSLVRARICKTEVRVGFNFLQRLINEVVESRVADAELYTEIDEIWQEVLAEDSDNLPPIPQEIYERSKARIFEAIGLTDSAWVDHERVITDEQILSEALTSSEKTTMSENTLDMVQIYNPGHPPSEPEMDPIPVVEAPASEAITRRLAPSARKRLRPIAAHSAAHRYWAEDKDVKWNIMVFLVIICVVVWSVVVVGSGP